MAEDLHSSAYPLGNMSPYGRTKHGGTQVILSQAGGSGRAQSGSRVCVRGTRVL